MANSAIFNQALLPAPKRNLIDMSQEHMTTLDAGWIVPVNITEMLPGDTFVGSVSHKIRTLPLNSPAFQSFEVGWFTAVVPMRLLMNNKGWAKFIAETPDESGATITPPAYVNYDTLANYGYHFDSSVKGVESQSLANYLGLPVYYSPSGQTISEDTTPINLMPFMAYQMVYDEWFRDNNLSDPVMEEIMSYFGDGGDCSYFYQDPSTLSAFHQLTQLRHRAFHKDMFTSALPTTQRGTQVVIPVGGNIEHLPINNIAPKFRFGGKVKSVSTTDQNPVNVLFGATWNGGTTLTDSTLVALGSTSYNHITGGSAAVTNVAMPTVETGSPYVQIQLGDGTGPYVNLTGVQGIEVNAFRTAMMIQTFLERLEVCGSRYTEVIRGMFGVYTPDARLQRPEMIAGWRSNILIGDVLQTEDPSTSSTPAGTLHGIGLGISGGKTFKYRAYEHAYLIQFVSILPKQAYGQGIPKMFTRQNRYDYFWPLLAHQGEEAILNREIKHVPGDEDSNTGVFGYQSRYYDYRSNYDRISGELTPGRTLAYWQGSRNFVDVPTLSMQFVECRFQDSGLSRIFPLDYYPTKNYGFFIADIYTKLKAWRPVPRFATPASI